MIKKLNFKIGFILLVVILAFVIGAAFVLTDNKQTSQESSRRIESDEAVVERTGDWALQENGSTSGGNHLYSSGSPNDVLTLTFIGSGVEVVYATGANLGILAVDVDRTVLQTVITADQDAKYQERTVVDFLEDGLHTLRVYAQEGGVIGIDAFYVSRVTQEAIIVDRHKMPNGVLEAARTQATVSVIVSLQDPEPSLSPGQEPDLTLIEDIQNRVLDNIKTGNIEVTSKYKSIPGFAAFIDLAALLELQANPLVISIFLPDLEVADLESSP